MPQMVPDANVGDKTLLTIILRLYSDRNLLQMSLTELSHVFQQTNTYVRMQ